MEKIKKTEEEWREILTDEQYKIMRQKGTETPFTCALLDEKRKGTFHCAACDLALFENTTKFESGSGWPSFFKSLSEDVVLEQPDDSLSMERTEILCARCESHLGHVFPDGPPPTGKRYCVNGIALNFKPEKV